MSAAHDSGERARINALIDFYERERPDSGQRIDLRFTPRQLCRLFDVAPRKSEDGRRQVYPADVPYRGRVLHATRG